MRGFTTQILVFALAALGCGDATNGTSGTSSSKSGYGLEHTASAEMPGCLEAVEVGDLRALIVCQEALESEPDNPQLKEAVEAAKEELRRRIRETSSRRLREAQGDPVATRARAQAAEALRMAGEEAARTNAELLKKSEELEGEMGQ